MWGFKQHHDAVVDGVMVLCIASGFMSLPVLMSACPARACLWCWFDAIAFVRCWSNGAPWLCYWFDAITSVGCGAIGPITFTHRKDTPQHAAIPGTSSGRWSPNQNPCHAYSPHHADVSSPNRDADLIINDSNYSPQIYTMLLGCPSALLVYGAKLLTIQILLPPRNIALTLKENGLLSSQVLLWPALHCSHLPSSRVEISSDSAFLGMYYLAQWYFHRGNKGFHFNID